MDTMKLTKAVASICIAWLVIKFGAWASDSIYAVGGHGHGDKQAYVVETDAAGGGAEAEAGPTITELLASADIGKGEKVYKKCQSCHKLEAGQNGTGPYLHGVVGRQIGTADGFTYSGALAGRSDAWTPENLDGFLTSPKGWASGTTMGFAGLKKAGDRANLIAYLQTIGG